MNAAILDWLADSIIAVEGWCMEERPFVSERALHADFSAWALAEGIGPMPRELFLEGLSAILRSNKRAVEQRVIAGYRDSVPGWYRLVLRSNPAYRSDVGTVREGSLNWATFAQLAGY